MPRKENLSLEERLERARQLYAQKQHDKRKNIQKVQGTKIYKLARVSCIVFLWISQLLFIDWALPFLQAKDLITDGYRSYTPNTKRNIAELHVVIKTNQYKKIEILLEEKSIEPQIHDSIIVYKSFLLHEPKKIYDVQKQETYLISGSVTYLLLPLLILASAMCVLFLFVRDIDSKAMYYFMLLLNTISAIAILIRYLYNLQ